MIPLKPFLAYEFRILHASACQPDSDNTATEELQSNLGEDVLATLLAYLSAGPAGQTNTKSPCATWMSSLT